VIIGERGGIYAHCTNATILAHHEPPKPARTTVGEILSGKFDGCLITVRGEITDAFVDEIDRGFIYLILTDGGQSIYMPMSWKHDMGDEAEALIGNVVEVTGAWIAGHNVGQRRNVGHILWISGMKPSDLQTIKKSGKGPFAEPEISDARNLGPDRIFTLGRRKVSGTVLASWHGDRSLLKTDDGYLVRLDLATKKIPGPGLRIEAVGLPESDLYNVNLRRVRWRRTAGVSLQPEAPEPVTAAYMLGFASDNRRSSFHGRMVQVTGIVRGLPSVESDGRIILEDGGFLLPVDFSKCPAALDGVDIGCTVEVNGIAVMEVDNWRPSAIFPQIKEVFVVVTAPDALTVLKRPSWWTAGRSMTAIGLLLAVILGVTIWNRSLKSLAERRGRELTEETVSRVVSELKVRERTRLAVELHDSIAQNLTGAIMEIRTGVRLGSTNHDGMLSHLEMAQKTLESCRHELRNCIWDMRNRALEQTDMDKAIRLTVTPQIGPTSLAVRFTVPRERISDNSAHAILRIIRELAVNAVRHGRATTIKVAGSIEDGKLMFSVTDNGTGFDPATAPGVEDGHFGLQGIRERVADFNGDFSFDSAPGKGTRACVKIRLPASCEPQPSQLSQPSRLSQPSQNTASS
jgi:signal transduction histidine kinase